MLGESQEAILIARHVQLCQTPCMLFAPIATLSIELFVYLVSVLLDLGMSVSCSYHVIASFLLCPLSIFLNEETRKLVRHVHVCLLGDGV